MYKNIDHRREPSWKEDRASTYLANNCASFNEKLWHKETNVDMNKRIIMEKLSCSCAGFIKWLRVKS